MLSRVPLSLAAVLVLGGALAGCGGGETPATAASSTAAPSAAASSTAAPSAAAASTAPSSAAHSTTSPSPHGEQSQNAKAKNKQPKKAKDPLAPNRIKPVVRNGKVPHPTVSAKPATFKGVVRYGDGVKLDVLGVTQGRVTGKGPGIIEGPTTSFSLSLTNGSQRSLNLNSVVVTTVHGEPARVASPIYQDKSRDFAGTVKAGKTARAVYTFAIPVDGRSQVTIHVDFDAVHTAAVFTGSAD